MTAAPPYRSQQDSDAAGFSHDCGPASCAMVIEAFTGIRVAIDALARQTSLPVQAAEVALGKKARASMGLHVRDLVALLSRYRINAQPLALTLAGFDNVVANGGYAIPLVEYGKIPARMDRMTGLHFFVVYARDGNDYLVADPLWYGKRRNEGSAMRVSRTDLANATHRFSGMSAVAYGLDKSSIPATHYIWDGPLNVRALPSTRAAIASKLPTGITVALDPKQGPKNADGYVWQKLIVPDGWVATKFLREIPV